MDNPRPEKVAVVDDVRSRLDQADAVIVTEYRGPQGKGPGQPPAEPRASGRASTGSTRTPSSASPPTRTCPSGLRRTCWAARPALTFVQGDAVAVTKALRDFARANPLIVIKGGLLGRLGAGPERNDVALADLSLARAVCWPAWRARWRHPCRRWPACWPLCPATSPTASQP